MNRFLAITSAIAIAALAAGVAVPPVAPAPATSPAPAPAPTPPAAPPGVVAPPSTSEPATPTARVPTAKERAKEIKEITGTIEIPAGTISFKLEPNKCPLLCANFCNLVRKGFFDGREWRSFSRVIRQCGTDYVWYTLPREFDASLFFDRGGRLAMSKDRDESAGARTNATRFFITIKGQERWNLDYPAFGNVTAGLPLVVDVKEGDKITKITVAGDVDNLLATFAPEIKDWDKEFEAAKRRGLK